MVTGVNMNRIAMDYLREVGGPKVVEKWTSRIRALRARLVCGLTKQEKIDQRAGQPPWWALATPNTLDTATSFIPRLMHDRLEDMGLDFAVLYPSASQLFAPYLGDEELRQVGCRA